VTVLAVDEGHIGRIVAAVREVPGIEVEHVCDRTFLVHLGGKLEVAAKTPLKTRDDLSMAYTPGVARICRAIADEPEKVWNDQQRAGLPRGVQRRPRRAGARDHRGDELAAAHALAEVVDPEDLAPDYVIPSVFNRAVAPAVAEAVAGAAEEAGIARKERQLSAV
jgi:malic enzyme